MGSEIRRGVFAPGMKIADRFELLRPLGRGTMGNLWVAHHETLDVDVALKFIDPDLLDHPGLRSRFAQEATAAAKIRSPHVVSVLDFGETEANQPYIAMELLHGESLAERLERDGWLSPADTVRMVVHLCKGLARAHARGIVHRDLKPENLFLCEDEEDDGFLLKILDFGIAKAEVQTKGILHRTITGQLVGTPLYMSPEQSVGRPATRQSDLYSVASLAYHCLAGRPVFDVENIALLLVHLATKDAPPLSKHLPNASLELESWFDRGLHREPDKRFASAREVAETFTHACQASVSGIVKFSLPPSHGDCISSDSWKVVKSPVYSVHALVDGGEVAYRELDETCPSPTIGPKDTLLEQALTEPTEEAGSSPSPSSSERVKVIGARGNLTPKPEMPKAEMPKLEMPKAEMPKLEMPKAEMPKAEMPKLEMPKLEIPKLEMPKLEMPKPEMPRPKMDEERALDLAPGPRGKDGALRGKIAEARAESTDQQSAPPEPVPETAPESAKISVRGKKSVAQARRTSTTDAILWAVGALVAIGIAIAVGWIIGQSL